MRLLDHTDENIQSQAKRALRSIFAFRMMYTTWQIQGFKFGWLKIMRWKEENIIKIAFI